MKKTLLLLAITLFFGNISLIKAQCYGNVVYDQTVSPAPTSSSTNSFTINTTHCNELIMISYDGFAFGVGSGLGPITVDGNNATWINTSTAFGSSSTGTVGSETYAYIAPVIGAHTINVNENGYAGTSGYDINFAADFYAINTVNPLTIASLTSTTANNPCASSGPITGSITTTKPNSMIYNNACYNDASSSSQAISWSIGTTFLGDTHAGYGIEASDSYTSAAAPGIFSITATSTGNTSYCTGLTMVLVAIPPPLCGTPLTASDVAVNPTCGNNNGSITVTAAGGDAPYTYVWSPNVSTTNVATGLSAGTYSITVSDANCNVCAPGILIVTLTGPVITLTANTTANEPCFGNCVGSATCNFSSLAVPYTYSWSPGAQTNATATGLCVGNYTVTATDNNGCNKTASITITQPALLTATTTPTNILCFNQPTGSIASNVAGGTVPYTYLWNPSAQTNATATGLSAGSYTVSVTDLDGCNVTSSATITQPTALTVNLTGPSLICLGQNGTLTATSAGGTVPYTYAWSSGLTSTTSTATISPIATTTYTVTVTDNNGCIQTTQITVNLGPQLFVNVTGGGNTWICGGLSTTLCAYPTGGTGGNTYLWQPGNEITPCITVAPGTTTTYTVSVADNCGTTTTASATVNINPAPNVGFTANLYQGCAPLCIQFYNLTTLPQGGLAQYTWAFGNGDTLQAQNAIYCYPNNGEYNVTLTVTDDSGCSATLKKINLITAFGRPNAAFTLSPQPATTLDPTIQFADISTDAYNLIYRTWSFGDETDSSSNQQYTSHTYQDTGRYCPRLIVMDEHGCTDTATNCLVIDPEFNLYIPSAFSPNGDGKNPTFEPKGQYVKKFEMYIFDRWGMLLCHTYDMSKGWDGTVNGSSTIAQQDTYVYKILVTDSKNKQHSYVGNVTLLR